MILIARTTHFVKPLSIVILLLACLGITISLQLPKLDRESSTDEGEYLRQEQMQATNLELADTLPSFGFNNLVANWMFLQFVQYFGDGDARDVTGYNLVPEYYQPIVERDPRFVSAHLHLSSANTMFAGRPKLSIELLEESLAHLSPEMSNRAFQLWVYKATDEMLFTDDLKAAKNSYQQAKEWAEQSDHASSDGIAGYAQRMINFLESDPDTQEARIGAWGMILMMSEQPAVQEEAIEEIEALGGEVVRDAEGRITGVRLPPEE